MFQSLEEAAKAGGTYPIPCTFVVEDPTTGHRIRISTECIGAIASKDNKVGESLTRYPIEYPFEVENTSFNLIDTPGLMDTGDTTDHDKDKEHISNILRLLSSYDEIHAICIVLKAGESRLSKAFKYTLTEILRHLDRDAFNNVIFVITHAASANFKPNDILSILDRFLKENKLHLLLPPDRPTVYCFENETVRYLAQCKNKIQPDEDDKEEAERNWNKSARSTTNMIDYFRSLNPHPLAGIKEIYSADHTIGVLSKLVLETLMCIFKDVDEVEQKKKEAEELKIRITNNAEQ